MKTNATKLTAREINDAIDVINFVESGKHNVRDGNSHAADAAVKALETAGYNVQRLMSRVEYRERAMVQGKAFADSIGCERRGGLGF